MEKIKTFHYKGYDIPLPYNATSVCFTSQVINSYPNSYFKEKKCRFCGKLFQPLAPSHHYCSDECAVCAAADSYVFRNYKITLHQYFEMYIAQEGKCYICKKQGFALREDIHNTKLVIDHAHNSSEVRGLLCPNCNRAIGLLKDNPKWLQTALHYVTKEHILPDNPATEVVRLFRNSKKRKANMTEEELFAFYDDAFINLLRTKELVEKYNITKETVRALKEGKSYKDTLLKYQERATTIH